MKKALYTVLFGLSLSTNLTLAQGQLDSILAFRQEYIQAFLEDEHSPLNKKGIKGLRFYPPDTSYMVTGIFTRTDDAATFSMPTSSGKFKEYVQYGVVHFNLHGAACSLNVYQSIALREMEAYKNYLFIPFNDETNGSETYGGGRYMDVSMEEIQNNQLRIDFNRCYNPYCAFSDGYSCPVPPADNKLPVAIKAGEMNYSGKKRH
jgi:uncharacterized protein (DUF1684 family)